MVILNGIIFIIKILFLTAGCGIAIMSIMQEKLPRGIIEWGIWIVDIVIIISGFIQGGVNG